MGCLQDSVSLIIYSSSMLPSATKAVFSSFQKAMKSLLGYSSVIHCRKPLKPSQWLTSGLLVTLPPKPPFRLPSPRLLPIQDLAHPSSRSSISSPYQACSSPDLTSFINLELTCRELKTEPQLGPVSSLPLRVGP